MKKAIFLLIIMLCAMNAYSQESDVENPYYTSVFEEYRDTWSIDFSKNNIRILTIKGPKLEDDYKVRILQNIKTGLRPQGLYNYLSLDEVSAIYSSYPSMIIRAWIEAGYTQPIRVTRAGTSSPKDLVIQLSKPK